MFTLLLDVFIKKELEDYDVTVLHFKNGLQELADSFRERMEKSATLYYMKDFQRCDENLEYYREDIFQLADNDYTLSVMFLGNEIISVGLYILNRIEDNLVAFLCVE
jgi:hypothetical protein